MTKEAIEKCIFPTLCHNLCILSTVSVHMTVTAG